MFKKLQQQLQDNLDKILKKSEYLYYVNIDREKVWEEYLNGYPEETRQEFVCNCCKSFIRQYAGIVGIIDNKKVSIWDNNINIDEEYKASISNLKNYIKSLNISNTFYAESVKCGTVSNYDPTADVTWNHFALTIPAQFVKRADTIDALKGKERTKKETFKRALDEITIDAVETVLELIAQKSLYKGSEYEKILTDFLILQKEYKSLVQNNYFAMKEHNYCWSKSKGISPVIAGIRNSAIGTLLVNLSEGMELDTAVTKFEVVVAPTNYKRPTALTTQKMVEDAKKKITELGLIESLDRRFATEVDLPIEDILYSDRISPVKDVFGEMQQDTVVNPKSFSKVEEVSIEDFIKNIIPSATGLEVLAENSHVGNFASILTSQHLSPSLFKWDNSFSWAYTGGITDSLKEKVAKLGGRIDGVFRFSHSWNEIEPNESLMDLHVFMPGNKHEEDGCHNNYGRGKRIGWNSRTESISGGNQDVDYINRAPKGYIPVENITFPDIHRMPEGKYICKIHNWDFRSTGGRGKAEIEVGGAIYNYEYPKTKNKQWITVAEVTLKNGEFTIEHKLPENSAPISKWNIKTNQFIKVKKVFLSPNHWNQSIGNKHYFFMLDNCINDEKVRPFFNEFLKDEFNENRKVFEILGSKLSISNDSANQLSGLGFSETQRNHLFVRVDGKFKRVLKIKF